MASKARRTPNKGTTREKTPLARPVEIPEGERITEAHTQKKTIVQMVNIPAHKRRVETDEYKAVRYRLIVEEDRPCLVCGVRNSTLDDPEQNPYGAKMLQCHHRVVEWSLANCIDLAKFNARIVATYRARGIPGYEHDFTQQQMLDWIDHDERNLWPLCDRHHVGIETGIHSLEYAVWSVQDLLLPGYQLTSRPKPRAKQGVAGGRAEAPDAPEESW